VFWDGAAAVSLFFVLSGLVLSLRYFRHEILPDLSRINLAEYFVGRVCRICLPYWVVLGLSAWLYQHYQVVSRYWLATIPRQNEWLPHMWGRTTGWADFFKDAYLLDLRMDRVFVPQAWTLSLELVLSLLIPVGVILAARSSLWLIAFSILAIYPLEVSPFLVHFMLGVLIAKHHGRIASWLQTQVYTRRGIAVLGFLLYTLAETIKLEVNPDFMGCLTGLGAGLLLLYVFASTRMQRILSYPVFHYLGKVSYSLYLIHFAALVYVAPCFLAWLDASPSYLIPAWWAGLLAVSVISVVLAGFCYRFIEVPSMALGKRFGRRLAAFGV